MTQLTTSTEAATPQTGSSPAPSRSPAPEAPDLGSDFSGTPDESPSPETPASRAPAFDPERVDDWSRVDPATVPKEYHAVIRQAKRQQADYTRKTQEVAEQRREVQRLQEQMAQLTQQQGQQFTQAVQSLTPAQQDRFADLRARLAPEDQGAIDVVEEIYKRSSADTARQLEEMTQKVDTLTQYLATMAQQVQTQRVSSATQQFREAVDRFGEDRLSPIVPNLKALIQTPNPRTGQQFTLTEAAALLLGETQQEAQSQRATDQQVRRQAKEQGRGTAGVSADTGNGPLTDTELFAELQGLGFR